MKTTTLLLTLAASLALTLSSFGQAATYQSQLPAKPLQITAQDQAEYQAEYQAARNSFFESDAKWNATHPWNPSSRSMGGNLPPHLASVEGWVKAKAEAAAKKAAAEKEKAAKGKLMGSALDAKPVSKRAKSW